MTNVTRRAAMLASAATAAGLAAPAVRAADPRRVVFWHNYTQKARSDFLRGVADRFEAANPGVKVEIEVVPFPAYQEKWVTAQAGGTLPDVTTLEAQNAVPMFMAGALHPADDLVRAVGGPDAFLPNLLDRSGRFRDQYISVPHYVHNRVMIYRKDRFAAAGINPPVTWDDALAATAATTKAPDHYGWILKLAKSDFGAGYLLWIMTRSAGGGFFDKDGQSTFDQPPVRDAVLFMTEVARRTGAPGIANYQISDNYTLINSGKESMTEDAAAIVGVALGQAPEVARQLDAVPMPRRTQVGNLVGAISVALPKGRNPEDGRRFAEFLYAADNYAPFLLTIPLFMFPALRAADAPFRAHPTIAAYPNLVQATLDGVQEGSLPGMEAGPNPYASAVFGSHAIEEMMQAIVVENTRPDDALAEASRKVTAVLRTTKARLGRT